MIRSTKPLSRGGTRRRRHARQPLRARQRHARRPHPLMWGLVAAWRIDRQTGGYVRVYPVIPHRRWVDLTGRNAPGAWDALEEAGRDAEVTALTRLACQCACEEAE